MPHVTGHTPRVSTRSVKPYACETSREKRQQDGRSDRQTDRHTDGSSKTTFLDVLRVVHPNKSGLISKSIFCKMQILSLTWKKMSYFRKSVPFWEHKVILQHQDLFFFGKQGWQKYTRKTKTISHLGNIPLLDICPILGTASTKLLNKT